MKPKVLNYGLAATHPAIVNMSEFCNPVSISDFDAFVFDPDAFPFEFRNRTTARLPGHFRFSHDPYGHMINNAILRRRVELMQLLMRKGGVVICPLLPNNLGLSVADARGHFSTFQKYAIFEELTTVSGAPIPLHEIAAGSGSSIRPVESQKGTAHEYLRILKGCLRFKAHFATRPPQLDPTGHVLAFDSVNNPIAVEFPVGAGIVSFVPVPHQNVPADRVGSALVQSVRRFFSGDAEIDEPEWAVPVQVPGANARDEEIAQLEAQYAEIGTQIDKLVRERKSLLDYKKLLFGYGKAALEPAVRSAFRSLGFNVPEPEEYEQDWDAFLTSPEGQTIICEIEGSENAIEVGKHRQLLDYVEAEAQEGRNHKGILVGNAFRLLPLDSPERQDQFTAHVLRGAQRNQFCLVPSTELFKVVCAVLENPTDEHLKKTIRDSLLSVVGPWAFAR